MATTKKTTAKKKSSKTKEDKAIHWADKEVFMTDVKRTIHDLWRLPSLLLAPVVAYINSSYDKIPQERKKYLQNILHEAKESSSNIVTKLKERLVETRKAENKWNKKTSSKTTKKKTSTTKISKKKETKKKVATKKTSTPAKKKKSPSPKKKKNSAKK